MATWDDLAAGTWDQIYTWDDPDRDIAIDAAYALGEVILDAPELTVDWVGDVPNDAISPTMARDEFPINVIATDSFNRSVASGIGATEQGSQYTTSGGSASDYNVVNGSLELTLGSLSVSRKAILAGLTPLNFDITMKFNINEAPTGVGGQVEHGIEARFQNSSNFVAARLFRNANSSNITVAVSQVSGGVGTASSFPSISTSTTPDIWLRFVGVGAVLYGYAWVDGDSPPATPNVTLAGVTVLTPNPIQFYSRLHASTTNPLPLTSKINSLIIISRDLEQTSVGAHPWAFSNPTTGPLQFGINDGYGTYRPDTVNVSTTVLIDDIVEADFDITVKVRATSLFTGARGTFLLYARYQDNSNFLRFRLDFNTDQVMGWGFESFSTAFGNSIIDQGLFPDIFHAVDGWFRFRVQGIGETLRLKAWRDDDRIDRDWTAYAIDTVFPMTAGKCGWGGYLLSGNTNPLPYVAWEVDQYWQGSNSALDGGQISVGLSLDDGMPSAVTNTSNIGVNEAGAELLGPIGTSPDVYFSTFRAEQPFADLDRDTAGVAITAQVLTSLGMRAVRVFTGRMVDIPIDDVTAKLQAVSATRLALSAPIQPPAVHGVYEGKEATWLIAFILFKASLYVAPRPLDGCRLYIPLNGTTHPYIPDTNSGAAAISGLNYGSLNTASYGAPSWIDGPFTAAPDLCVNETDVRKIASGPGTLSYSAFAPGSDFLSQAGNKGRIECWFRADGTNIASSMNPGQGDLIRIKIRNSANTRYAMIVINNTRTLMAIVSDGTTSFSYPVDNVPIDGRWHFIACTWDIAGNQVKVIFDGDTGFFGSGLSTGALPAVDDLDRFEIDLAIPTCEIRLTSGSTATKAGWAHELNFSPDAVLRRSLLQMEAVAEPAPREAFEMLSNLAQAELAQVGFDEQDRILYLPMSYWAEPDQQVVQEILSTDDNLGKKFKAARDVSRIYNQITLSYKQTYVNENWVTGFQTSQLVRVGGAESVDIMATMSTPIIEVRGLTLAVMSGSALAATPPSVTNAINYVTLNTAQDGTGTYAGAGDVVAKVLEWTPGSVTIRLQNNSPNTYYLANNVSIPPLGIGVKQAVTADASVSAVQASSVATRGIRNLPVSLAAIQTPANAATIAAALAGFLAYPRTTLVSDAWGDFRRSPGTLVSVRDVDGTGIDLPFRLTGITTTQNGAEVQQAISAVQAWLVQSWGSGAWGSGIWGGA
jgi:hypothetical protein